MDTGKSAAGKQKHRRVAYTFPNARKSIFRRVPVSRSRKKNAPANAGRRILLLLYGSVLVPSLVPVLVTMLLSMLLPIQMSTLASQLR
jgi:hypothetical protein